MTPDAFQTEALAWLKVAGVVGGALAAAAAGALATAATLLPRIAALRADVETLFGLHKQNAGEINRVALATPPQVPPIGGKPETIAQ